MELYLVQGCGVSLICEKDSIAAWVQYIVDRGGIPNVQRWSQEIPLCAA